MDKLVWSNSMTKDYAVGLSDEGKMNFLLDRGYDADMLGDLMQSRSLDDIILEDEYIWEDDAEEFENVIAPMIASQTKDGLVIMIGEAAKWNGTRQAGTCVLAESLVGGDIDRDVDEIEITDDGEGLVWSGHHHDGTHHMKLYAVPENNEDVIEFVTNCMADYVDELVEFNDYDEHEAIETVTNDLTEKTIDEYCDFSKVPEVCERIKNRLNEELTESAEVLTEVKTNDPENLQKELNEIKPLADEYGFEYFTAMPFTAFDNDPDSVEIMYPNLFKVVKAFFKEMGLLTKEELNDSDVLDNAWDQNFFKRDWDTVIKTIEKMLDAKNKSNSAQIEKIYKSVADDDYVDPAIKQEPQDDEWVEEALNEDTKMPITFDPYEAYDFVGKSYKLLEDLYLGYFDYSDWELNGEFVESSEELAEAGLVVNENEMVIAPTGMTFTVLDIFNGYPEVQFECGLTIDLAGEPFQVEEL